MPPCLPACIEQLHNKTLYLNADKVELELFGHSTSQQGLARARWAIQENPAPLPNGTLLKDARVLHVCACVCHGCVCVTWVCVVCLSWVCMWCVCDMGVCDKVCV